MKTEFFMPMIPPTITHQEQDITIVRSKKKGKLIPIVYDPTELKAARVKLQGHLGQHVPTVKYTGSIQVVVKWCFPITGKHQDGEWKKTKPDTHNLNKLLFDVMTKLSFWTDDAIVCSEIIQKFWAERPGIFISIEDLEG